MRGFIGGLVIGLITIVIAVVALALLAPAQQAPVVADGAPQAASGAEAGGESGGLTGASDADLAETAPTAPGTQSGQSDTLSSLQDADRAPADKPSVGAAIAGLSDPVAAPQAPGVTGSPDAPPTALPRADAPASPQGDTQPAALANPVQPQVPEVTQAGSGLDLGLGTGPITDESAPQIAANTDTAPASDGGGAATTAPDTDTSPDPATASATQTTPDPQTGQAPVPQVSQSSPSEPTQPDATQAPSTPQVAALPQAGAIPDDQGPSIGKRVVPLTERGQSTGPLTSADTTTQAATDADAAPADGPWIKINAAIFDNPDNRPVMAIVLIDDEQGLGAEALADFPYPLSFAVDPSAPDAAAKMARHRAAGFEVVALTNLPVAANAQDAEVSLSVWLDTLPQVVALLEGTGTGMQGNRDLSDQVTAIAASTGLGLIMQSKGLNTAQKLAARAGVPSAVVFRDFDGAGQSPEVMRRFLDQAAFRAGQQGGVIMLGRLRPDTISALILWGLQDRASRLALAPVSAVLTRSASGQ